MKLLMFVEYIDNNYIPKSIPFNDNELKLLNAKTIYMNINGRDMINFKHVQKLSNGEYLVLNDNFICSTINSLIKYTKKILETPKRQIIIGQ